MIGLLSIKPAELYSRLNHPKRCKSNKNRTAPSPQQMEISRLISRAVMEFGLGFTGLEQKPRQGQAEGYFQLLFGLIVRRTAGYGEPIVSATFGISELSLDNNPYTRMVLPHRDAFWMLDVLVECCGC